MPREVARVPGNATGGVVVNSRGRGCCVCSAVLENHPPSTSMLVPGRWRIAPRCAWAREHAAVGACMSCCVKMMATWTARGRVMAARIGPMNRAISNCLRRAHGRVRNTGGDVHHQLRGGASAFSCGPLFSSRFFLWPACAPRGRRSRSPISSWSCTRRASAVLGGVAQILLLQPPDAFPRRPQRRAVLSSMRSSMLLISR